MNNKKLYRRKPELPLLLRQMKGAVGKEFVVKHYRYGAIRTKYPDMSNVVASAKLRKCRTVFQEAVAYAKSVIADKGRKAQWQRKLRRHNGVYNAAIKEYMLREKCKKLRDRQRVNWLLWMAFRASKPVVAVRTYHNIGGNVRLSRVEVLNE